MVPVRPDLPRPVQDAIDGPRQANRQALHTPGQSLAALGLDQHVDVVALDRKVADAKGPALGEPERVP